MYDPTPNKNTNTESPKPHAFARTRGVTVGASPARLAVALPIGAAVGVGATVRWDGACGAREAVVTHAGTIVAPGT